MSSPDVTGRPTSPQVVDRPHRGPVLGIGLAVVTGLIVGAASEWSVLHLPFDLTPLSNAAGPWILVAFLAARTARRSRAALVLSVATLLALVAGFYAAQAARGWPVDGHQVAFWCVTTVVVGPLLGLAAGWLRHHADARSAVGAGIPGGVLAGEALHGLGQATFLTPHVFWYAQFGVGTMLGAGLALYAVRRRGDRAPAMAAAWLAAFAVTALATVAAFQIS